jgi:hypothetical protein
MQRPITNQYQQRECIDDLNRLLRSPDHIVVKKHAVRLLSRQLS